ncbi:hypothetical protein PAXINDRAFT_21634 [Paxillus involutus ATCC 200175]|uniref:Uncharacterized protein n=1 Tax=Paxillus involutus ATCC 200175 TaxID=664439 RepID=A0A0C9TCW1_PAXIN|nr:hypothetical protein PAXINDRAFT_21634 [Paxillus involutus ATCC 200175]
MASIPQIPPRSWSHFPASRWHNHIPGCNPALLVAADNFQAQQARLEHAWVLSQPSPVLFDHAGARWAHLLWFMRFASTMMHYDALFLLWSDSPWLAGTR